MWLSSVQRVFADRKAHIRVLEKAIPGDHIRVSDDEQVSRAATLRMSARRHFCSWMLCEDHAAAAVLKQ